MKGYGLGNTFKGSLNKIMKHTSFPYILLVLFKEKALHVDLFHERFRAWVWFQRLLECIRLLWTQTISLFANEISFDNSDIIIGKYNYFAWTSEGTRFSNGFSNATGTVPRPLKGSADLCAYPSTQHAVSLVPFGPNDGTFWRLRFSQELERWLLLSAPSPGGLRMWLKCGK